MTDLPDGTVRPSFNPQVFYSAAGILALTVLIAAVWPEATGEYFAGLQKSIVANGSWYYVLVVAIILVSVVLFTFSRFGDIRLGPDHAEPSYSFLSWFAMMFSAGMGIGLMFFGVSEPVMHFLSPPAGGAGSVAAAREAMVLTFFHWGIHAWAMYAIVALILAYFGYRHGLPLTIRSALYPIIGERIYGPWGTAVDVFAIICTVAGVATSLGFGVLQINAGLSYLFDLPNTLMMQVFLIAVTTGLATVSVVMGLDAGIKRLSELNIILAVVLLLLVLVSGPTVQLLQTFMQNTGNYLAVMVSKTFNLYAYSPTDWLGGWTIFYWGWWLSWSPFVGLFIARISRGRTIREFVLGALLGPTLFTFLWMTVFGNSAIELILNQGAADLGDMVQQDPAVALFQFFEYLPVPAALVSFVAVVMIVVFFVTSADSGAMVVNMLASDGRDDTPVMQRVFWTCSIGLIGAILLVAGGLPSLQTAAIASALPFSVVLLFAIWGFVQALRQDVSKRDALSVQTVADSSIPWQERLDKLLHYSNLVDVSAFLQNTVKPAMTAFAEELRSKGISATVESLEQPQAMRLLVLHGEETDFVYTVRANQLPLPDEALQGRQSTAGPAPYWRGEVHLMEGGQDYDVMGWTVEQLVNDMLDQYERHLNYLNSLR